MKRTKTIKKNLWLSPEENKLMVERARRAGLTQTSLIRMMLKGFVPKDRPSPELRTAVMDQINLTNALHRLADKAKIHGYENAEELRNLADEMCRNNLKIEEELLLPEDHTDFWKK